jgi:type IV pilus assembly protein PilW
MTALTLIGEHLQMAAFVPADMPRTFIARPGLFVCTGGGPIGADDSLTCEPLATHSDGVAVRYVADNISTCPSTAGLATDCLGRDEDGCRCAARHVHTRRKRFEVEQKRNGR